MKDVFRFLACAMAAATLATATLTTAALANEFAEPDPAQSPHWGPIKQLLFGDRIINPDDRDVVRVYLSTRADDASTVPIAVKAQIDQTESEYIKTIYLIVERNPSQTAGVFRFTPQSGRAQVETRLRFEDYSFVRAVAEMNDGRLYMSQRWVKAAGGCSAPSGKNAVPAALLGKMRLRFDYDSVTFNQPNLVQLMIRHPNESAMAADLGERVPQFVRSVRVTYDGMPVMDAQVDFSISDNPNFRFFFTPQQKGELRIEVEDTHDRRYVHSVTVAEGLPLPGG